MLYRVNLAWARFKLTTFVVIGTDCIGNWKYNYYAITTMNAPVTLRILVLIDGPGNGWIHAIMNINILKYYFGPLLRWSFLSPMETTITNMDLVVPWLFLQQNNPRGHEYHTIIDPVIVLFILTFLWLYRSIWVKANMCMFLSFV